MKRWNRIADVLDSTLSRRAFIAGSASASALALLPMGAPAGTARPAISFTPVPTDTADRVRVPPGYRVDVLCAWGDPVSSGPPFRFDAGNTADEQLQQFGMHHDGMAFFPMPGRLGVARDDRALLCINHEYVDNGLLFPDGQRTWSAAKVSKAQHAHGVSVVEIERTRRDWRIVRPSRFARRVTARTPIAIAGPARGVPAMRTADDPAGTTVLGTLANCAHGQTPWGTYLTCEENFHEYFGATRAGDGDLLPEIGREYSPEEAQRLRAALPSAARRYDVGTPEFEPARDGRVRLHRWGLGHRWYEHDARFDCSLHPHEANRFGWVVEIDPFDPASTPVKRTALGRFKHESATVTLARDGRVVVYSGDDEKDEYLYKFVSRGRYEPANGKANAALLDEGTLYVARFEAGGRGEWRPLVHGRDGLTPGRGLLDQGDVLIRAREAGDVVGGTRMDRAEWVAVAPNGDAYVTCTNNTTRSEPNPANPRTANVYGHVLRWREAGGDPAATAFEWETFIACGDPRIAERDGDPAKRGDVRGEPFGSPDGLHVDRDGRVWICTDVSPSKLLRGDYALIGNNQLLCADPVSREVRRFLTGPPGSEITGPLVTPDGRALFVNVQHPGEGDDHDGDPGAPRKLSNWPDHRPDGRPRSATLVIRRVDGGPIGT